jgi:hypothetical protein
VIHNMGRSCPQCTLWADGFNGIDPNIADRAAFVIASPDPPDAQHSFTMVSHQHSSFVADVGRVANTGFEGADGFCALWHLFNLSPEGAGGWHPEFTYR